jgi:hypothetical protein
MAYIGSTPTSQNFISGTDYFNGTGSQTVFTLTRTVNSVNDIDVVVNNVVQQPNSYTVVGTALTLSVAPSSGTSNVYVRYISTNTQVIAPSQGTVNTASIADAAVTTAKLGNITSLSPNGTNTVTFPTTTGTVALTSQVIGVGQTWQDVKASRSSGVTYTNSTGKPIFASASVGFSGNATIDAYVGGVYMGTTGVVTSGGTVQMCILIPNGSTYSFTSNNGGFNSWAELR